MATPAKDIAEILQDALSLPKEARAALAGQLLESLDDEVDPGAEEAWRNEIAERLRLVDAGTAKAIPWAKARSLIQSDDEPIQG